MSQANKLAQVLNETDDESPKSQNEDSDSESMKQASNKQTPKDFLNDKNSLHSPEKMKKGINTQCTSLSKCTCKYEIPISNLPGFSVARKIIGYRGKNMKNILNKLKDSHFKGPIQDIIKLRLRGQGSGFKEGPNERESDEPLHLCVSSQYHEKYIEACKLVEKLLKDIYREFNNFCSKRGRPTKHYKIIKMENSPACFLSNYSSNPQQ